MSDSGDETYNRMKEWIIAARQRGLSDAEIVAALNDLRAAATNIGDILNHNNG